jgi:hypothetical protein
MYFIAKGFNVGELKSEGLHEKTQQQLGSWEPPQHLRKSRKTCAITADRAVEIMAERSWKKCKTIKFRGQRIPFH